MKKHAFKLLAVALVAMLASCAKTATPAAPQKGTITFWISHDDGCGPVTVTIDGTAAGQITHWQVNAPGGCTQSNVLLSASTTQGTKVVTFKNACRSWTANINLSSDCYVYMVY